MSLIQRTRGGTLRHWQVARLDIERDLEVIREHVLRVVKRVVDLVLAVIEDEQLVSTGICSRLLVDQDRGPP